MFDLICIIVDYEVDPLKQHLKYKKKKC